MNNLLTLREYIAYLQTLEYLMDRPVFIEEDGELYPADPANISTRTIYFTNLIPETGRHFAYIDKPHSNLDIEIKDAVILT